MFGIPRLTDLYAKNFEQQNSHTVSNGSVQRFVPATRAPKPWIASNVAANINDMSATKPHQRLNAGLRDIMARHLGIDIDMQGQDGHSSSSSITHTRTYSNSSRPSLSCSFASSASTGITTPVLDHNQFDMPKTFREQEVPPKISRDELKLTKYRSYEEEENPPAEFIPSAILKGESRSTKPEMVRKAAKVGIAINPNYKGEITKFNLRNAMCLNDENSSVRIHNIHPEASHAEIFAVITHGKVFSFNYIPPTRGLHTHAAADLAFVSREAAEYFLRDSKIGIGLQIRSQRIVVLWNRVKVMPANSRYEKKSRVIKIKGPADDFSVKILEDFFRSKFEFNLITGKEWIQWDGSKIVELAFASIRSQSESAMKSFKLYVDQNMPNAGYQIWYAQDPCARANRENNL